MGLPRSKYVKEGEEGVYHCYSRCVRRAFLCGYDALTGRDFSHRKKWIVDRLRFLASIFAIDVCAYAIMENHPHTILRTRPDILASWSDHEVAAHWINLCPQKRRIKGNPIPFETQIKALAECPERIAVLRKRLCSVSWFMAKLNEFIAREANKEDKVKGRFWESRFKCQVLLDGAAIAAGMVYVDLNLIRAGVASTPEDSDFTSIQERIRAWQKETMAADADPGEVAHDSDSGHAEDNSSRPKDAANIPASTTGIVSAASSSLHDSSSSDSWLCPIQSTTSRRGILEMSAMDYFELVDRSGRMIRSDKRGFIDARLEPILNRIGAIPKTWAETISHFGSAFKLAAGRLANLREFAARLDRSWFKGLSIARSAFT
jgi:hypothetical protein